MPHRSRNIGWTSFADVLFLELIERAVVLRQEKRAKRRNYPLVSILIPTHNRPEYFRQALASALSHFHGTYFQLLMDDDLIAPNKIELMLACYEQCPTATRVLAALFRAHGKSHHHLVSCPPPHA